MKKILIILFVLSILIISSCSNTKEPTILDSKHDFDYKTKSMRLKNNIIEVEIADSAEMRNYGLMFRESLDEDKGMLFIFPSEEIRSFWMKNTLIPLDIIYLDANLEVINIAKANPCKEDPCPNYLSRGPSMFVLEINQNKSEEFNISKGSIIRFAN